MQQDRMQLFKFVLCCLDFLRIDLCLLIRLVGWLKHFNLWCLSLTEQRHYCCRGMAGCETNFNFASAQHAALCS